ncbi:NfeD family protein [Clostridium bovifaecis]|uniref:NfeD family protein n=1 Tax=Clostridium bovifaecis TaxID=2184719 RepID=A0A6I6F510_9CLOT|nr:NfeD family protein [Clostridium bovifaecis]
MGGYLLLWIIIAAVALGIDIITSSFLFIWFTIGGIVSMVLAILGFPFSTQLISFIGVSAALMAICYPYVKKTIKKTVPITPTMEENYIGQEFISDKDIEQKATIKYEGIYWTVKNEGEYIQKGDKVKIIGIEGNKLLVKKL